MLQSNKLEKNLLDDVMVLLAGIVVVYFRRGHPKQGICLVIRLSCENFTMLATCQGCFSKASVGDLLWRVGDESNQNAHLVSQ